ncbi:MAG TPA: class I SAM-dependent methyltransferase [Thiothrix sp.]|nr:class I SAM-dependent methyltransferase [Thiothrix sp.]
MTESSQLNKAATAQAAQQSSRMEAYYRFHAKIYNATRWSFLFGRKPLLKHLAQHYQPKRILEIGCGTGQNLLRLRQQFPQAHIVGLDASETMLAVARKQLLKHDTEAFKQLELLATVYDAPLSQQNIAPFDLIVVSYTLSMINPGWEEVVNSTTKDLSENGVIAVVDFHDSSLKGFKRWMAVNHVQMHGHLYNKLSQTFHTEHEQINKAYFGVWKYMSFIGSMAKQS